MYKFVWNLLNAHAGIRTKTPLPLKATKEYAYVSKNNFFLRKSKNLCEISLRKTATLLASCVLHAATGGALRSRQPTASIPCD